MLCKFLLQPHLVSMLRSAFLGEEGGKMVMLKFSLESKMLHNFQVNISNMTGTAIFKYANQVY